MIKLRNRSKRRTSVMERRMEACTVNLKEILQEATSKKLVNVSMTQETLITRRHLINRMKTQSLMVETVRD
jgi:hypothetical protein